ncbi:MAG TPA: glycosyltransferase [Vicinamibacteria bacterium]|nr:glycosyltransferase [Vicinamibacteria bacterium]
MAIGVLHVCDKFGVAGSSIHGVSRLFAWWFPRFDPARFAVSLVGLKKSEPASQKLVEQGVPVLHLGRGRFDPRIVTDLVAIARARGARILHVHGYAAADFGRLAARVVGARLVLHEHFADPRMPAYQALADRLLAPLTHRAIAVSGSTRDFLVRERHVPERLVRLIWNGAPLDEFAPVSRERALRVRRELLIPEEAPVVGAIGRLNTQKGHTYLLEAAPRILQADGRTFFLIVGDGDLMDPLRQQARALGLGDRVRFAGHRSDVPDVLGAIDVLAIPSLYEGTPLALFEAMAAGKAIVSSAVDGCAEVLEHGRTALLVPPRDKDALAAAIGTLLADPDQRRALSEAARAASRAYDIATCVARMQDLYDEVLAADVPRRPGGA